MPETPKDVSIGMTHWSGKRKATEPTLTISLDALSTLLYNESAVINHDDVPRLLGAIHTYAVKANASEDDALARWETVVAEMEIEMEADDVTSADE